MLAQYRDSINIKCQCKNRVDEVSVIVREGIDARPSCSAQAVYGLYCKEESCKRILYVGSIDAQNRLKERKNDHKYGRSSTFCKDHIGTFHKIDDKKSRQKFFEDKISMIVLYFKENAEENHTLRKWEIFWQCLLRAHVSFTNVIPRGCSKH